MADGRDIEFEALEALATGAWIPGRAAGSIRTAVNVSPPNSSRRIPLGGGSLVDLESGRVGPQWARFRSARRLVADVE